MTDIKRTHYALVDSSGNELFNCSTLLTALLNLYGKEKEFNTTLNVVRYASIEDTKGLVLSYTALQRHLESIGGERNT